MIRFPVRPLGAVKPPPGYRIVRVDDHWMWVHEVTDRESAIHWNRWEVYRWAVADHEARQDA